MTKSVKRLFSQFQPIKYVLHIEVDRDNSTFKGSVIISGKRTGRPSQRLTLHQNGLNITDAQLIKTDKKGQTPIAVDRINHHKKYDEVRLHTKDTQYPGHYTVSLNFEGKITRPMNGIYPCFFQHNDVEKKLIATQFESHHAREVFPCIDEPEAKATFELALTTPVGETVLSNTPVQKSSVVSNQSSAKDSKGASKQNTENRLQKTVFEPTPHMSTYLLAFIFGELGYKEAKTHDGVIVRAYATPDNVQFTDFALDVAVKCLEFYNEYFGIKYPLDKCDLIALPDFASGAMENWGCITFREQTMLVDPNNSSLHTKQYVALVVAHELTHQWFGNLVTMRWWTDLWLNEGFATWMEYLAIDKLFPEWQVWTQFAVDEQQQALKLDALENTHPIEVAVNHPDEIRTIFDTISYSKGASVIHMLHEYLGPEDFRDGLCHYLKTHKYNNTDTVDLWASLEEISGKPVRDFMNAWTSQSGFPLLTAKVTDTDIRLSQERFFINTAHAKNEPAVWPVPLLSSDVSVSILNKHTDEIHTDSTERLKLNVGQSGFYRTAYNPEHTQKLGNLIDKNLLSPLDRLGILTDLFETAKAGKSSTKDALEFLSHFSGETNYAVWDVIASSIGSLRGVMDDETLRENMKPYVRKLVKPELKRLGWDKKKSDSHFDKLLRPIILGLAAGADEPAIVKRCQELFAKIDNIPENSTKLKAIAKTKTTKLGSDIDPDLRGTVFGTVARLGGEEEFNKLLGLHNASNLSEERTTIAAALTGFRQPKLIERSLDLIDSETVRLQDVAYWIAYGFMNRHAKYATWEWVKLKWDWLDKNMGTDLSFYRMPIYAGRAFSDSKYMKEYVEFFGSKLSPAFERPYKQGLEILEIQIAWKSRALDEVKTFFENKLN